MVDTISECFKIRVRSADDNAAMVLILFMQADEVAAVQADECSALGSCPAQQVRIRDATIRKAVG